MTSITTRTPTRQRDPWREYAAGRLTPAEIRQLAADTPPVRLARRARHRKPSRRPLLPLWAGAMLVTLQAKNEMTAAARAQNGGTR